MFTKILVPLDGTPWSNAALPLVPKDLEARPYPVGAVLLNEPCTAYFWVAPLGTGPWPGQSYSWSCSLPDLAGPVSPVPLTATATARRFFGVLRQPDTSR
jgi:hypothetical protein